MEQVHSHKTTLSIKQWGNSLGVRLPSTLAKQANLRLDQRISLFVEEGKIIISPIDWAADSLQAKLAKFDPNIHSGEAMQTTESLGAEKI